MAKGIFAGLKGVDAFGKTTDDVKVKTRTGAFLTLVSAAIILSFTLMEFIDYRTVYTDTSLIVDKSRGEKLSVRMNITFPRVPCYLLNVDVVDISGETQTDISHSIRKTRLSHLGDQIRGSTITGLQNDIEKNQNENSKPSDYCGSCYGGKEPESGCCNTCEEVRSAYIKKGWSFTNPDAIEQCKSEGWLESLKDQANEGCHIVGRIRVNKVTGNIHLSPGKSFQGSRGDVYELVPYLRDDGNKHDYSHTIHEFSFDSEDFSLLRLIRTTLNVLASSQTTKAKYMYQYFLKVVSTHFRTIDNQHLRSNQYSVTHFERDVSEGVQGDTAQGVYLQHGMYGVPGIFFNYEISPILVVHTDTRQSFAHFITSICAIIGGVLTVAQLFDSVLFATTRALKKKA
ncbi:hypothetical protein D9757_009614 [Collybiopsis confluens]|uniref:Endoplasmic reticulum-Golgi intermediate compartment protein 3 n=1 Tax=Collybiopsis confluens TaxID=2823264 RepID=A0A8H5LWN1_9AGAR|nr:hypothetical protein D9757_010342 [Collybiopsis confluens]KAF5372292.1 hypothetical protein D9757_009614 [Collybiopsis confluens]